MSSDIVVCCIQFIFKYSTVNAFKFAAYKKIKQAHALALIQNRNEMT